jgi:hypothetical protein
VTNNRISQTINNHLGIQGECPPPIGLQTVPGMTIAHGRDVTVFIFSDAVFVSSSQQVASTTATLLCDTVKSVHGQSIIFRVDPFLLLLLQSSVSGTVGTRRIVGHGITFSLPPLVIDLLVRSSKSPQ